MQWDENMTPFSIDNLLVNSPWLTISREKRERGANHPGGKVAHECLAFQHFHRSTASTHGMGQIQNSSTRLGKPIQSIHEEPICHFLARPEARSFLTLLLNKINNHPHENRTQSRAKLPALFSGEEIRSFKHYSQSQAIPNMQNM